MADIIETGPWPGLPRAGSELIDDANKFAKIVSGYWTPTVIGVTTDGTCTYATRIGSFVKIGNLVTLSASIDCTGHTGTGDLVVKNLPFVPYTLTKASGGLSEVAHSNGIGVFGDGGRAGTANIIYAGLVWYASSGYIVGAYGDYFNSVYFYKAIGTAPPTALAVVANFYISFNISYITEHI